MFFRLQSMKTALLLSIPNQLAALPQFIEDLNVFLQQNAVPPEATFRVNLAVEELLTNIIQYGYTDTTEHVIELSITREPEHVLLVVSDDGTPFNPLENPPPDIHQPLDQRKIGGLGIHLVRQIAEEIAYRHENNRNRLDLRIRI